MIRKRKTGFALLSLAERRRISSLGGKAVPPEKRGFAKSREFAAMAGHLGGKATHKKD